MSLDGRGIYLSPGRVNPSVAITSGSVRVGKIVVSGTSKRVIVQVTSKIKCVSDGGDIVDANATIERGVLDICLRLIQVFLLISIRCPN